MKSFRTQLKKGTMSVALSCEEREAMRGRIVEYMEFLPLARDLTPITSEASAVRSWRLFGSRHIVGALAVALMVTTTTYSVTNAATDALPGDLLWPVKVHVNEGVKTVFVNGDEAQVAWERERMELRLEEASSLAAQGRLDAERQDVVSKQFAIQAEAAVEKVREIETRDPVLAAEASAELADTLDTHKAVLARMVVEQEAEGVVEEGARTFVEEVHRAAFDAESLREETEKNLSLVEETDVATSGDELPNEEVDNVSQVDTNVTDGNASATVQTTDGVVQEKKNRAAQRARDRATDLQTRAEELIEARDQTDKIVPLAREQVVTAGVLIAEGDAALTDGSLSRAYGAFRQAASILHKTIALLKVAETYNPELTQGMLEEYPVASETANIQESHGDGGTEEVQARLPSTNATGFEASAAESPVSREEVVRMTDEVQGMLAERKNGDNASFNGDAYRYLKDAIASTFRADIALSLGNTEEAVILLSQAYARATAARDLLKGVDSADSTSNPPHDPALETIPEEISPEVVATSTLSVRHSFDDLVHTYEGVIPNISCVAVDAHLSVAEVPHTVLSLALTTTPLTSEDACEGQSVSYRATTSAPAAVDLISILLNGEAVSWSIEEVVSREESTVPPQTESLIRRTIEGAQKMLGGE